MGRINDSPGDVEHADMKYSARLLSPPLGRLGGVIKPSRRRRNRSDIMKGQCWKSGEHRRGEYRRGAGDEESRQIPKMCPV